MRRTITSLPGACGVPLVLLLLGLALIALNGCGPAPGIKASPGDPVLRPAITSAARIDHIVCGADELGVRADGQLTNITNAAAAFEFTVEFRGRDDLVYATAAVRTTRLAKDEVFVWEAVPDVPAMPGGHCEIAADGPVVALPIEERG